MSSSTLTPQKIMSLSPIVPVIEIEDVSQSIDLAHALIAGGINVLEITLRTDVALEAIKILAKEVPEANIGAGTVMNASDLARVRDTGASFALSPGSSAALLEQANQIDFPLIPGVSTGSEIIQGMDLGYTHFKLFPATVVGGIPLLNAFGGPYQDIRFCPTGGVNENNYLDFLALENVLCVGGSWIVPKEAIATGKFEVITEITSRALSRLNK